MITKISGNACVHYAANISFIFSFFCFVLSVGPLRFWSCKLYEIHHNRFDRPREHKIAKSAPTISFWTIIFNDEKFNSTKWCIMVQHAFGIVSLPPRIAIFIVFSDFCISRRKNAIIWIRWFLLVSWQNNWKKKNDWTRIVNLRKFSVVLRFFFFASRNIQCNLHTFLSIIFRSFCFSFVSPIECLNNECSEKWLHVFDM